MKYILYITTGLFLSFFPSCIKNPNCQSDRTSSYEFDMPYTLSPVSDTFSAGDTMWINYELSNNFTNKITDKKTYTLNNFDFEAYMAVQDLKTNPLMPTGDFKLVFEDGSDDPQKNSFSTSVIFDFANNTYRWKRGIVWTNPGWFIVNFASDIPLDVLRQSGQSITKCPTEFLHLNFRSSNSGKNAYLMQEAADENFKNLTEDQMGSWMAFYVKE